MKEDSKIEFLKKLGLFSSLTHEELSRIAGKIAVKNFKKNQTILYERDTNEFMYIILDGKVKVVQTTDEGKEVILAMHESGDFFGEMSLIDGKTSPATVLATCGSTVAVISKKDFLSMIFNQNKVLEKLLQILCVRLREAWDRIQMLNFNNATQRIKLLFVMLSERYGKKEDGGIILNVKLTHQEIADMTGMARETITRVIDRWQKDREIVILKNRYIRLNPDFCKDFRYEN